LEVKPTATQKEQSSFIAFGHQPIFARGLSDWSPVQARNQAGQPSNYPPPETFKNIVKAPIIFLGADRYSNKLQSFYSPKMSGGCGPAAAHCMIRFQVC